VSIPAVVSKQP